MPSFVFVQNTDKPIDRPARLQVCTSFGCRLRGLMFRSSLSPDEGLLFQMPRESRIDTSIHMFFVPFVIAVVWINSSMRVVDRLLAKPWHPAYISARPARYILELHPDRLADYETDQVLRFDEA